MPHAAIDWIKLNIKYDLRKVEFYKRLTEEKLINPSVHTYHQVYYWVLKLSAGRYILNANNQIASVKEYMQTLTLIGNSYKLILHIENDFVQALGFITPFTNEISKDNINQPLKQIRKNSNYLP